MDYSVLVLPVHHPVVMAKRVATLDALSGGRVRLAVGAGWMREEIESCGVDFATRGRRMGEQIEVLRKLWSQHGPEGVDHQGEFYEFRGAMSYRKPVRPGGIPIHMGGHSLVAARRAGRSGDGLQPLGVAGDELARIVTVMRTEAERSGRDPNALELTVKHQGRGSRRRRRRPLRRVGQPGCTWAHRTPKTSRRSRMSSRPVRSVSGCCPPDGVRPAGAGGLPSAMRGSLDQALAMNGSAVFVECAFFSFTRLEEDSSHRSYSEWLQLDHRPENLASPGVALGGRWRRTEGCARAEGSASAQFADVDYVSMYWFRAPVQESAKAWRDLSEASFLYGRGPVIPGVRRLLTSFFLPVKGYVAGRALVSPEVLPFSPNRGLHVELSHSADPHGLSPHDYFRWQDRTCIPDLLTVEGVADAWTFTFDQPQRHPSIPGMNEEPDYAPHSLRMRLLYLDEDPVEVTQAIREREARWGAGGRGAPPQAEQEMLFSAPFRTIVPWEDW